MSAGHDDLSVWFPAARAGSGADVFTERLAAALTRRGVRAIISWFPHWSEITPDLFRLASAPAGTNVIHANSAYAFAFRRRGTPLVVTEHHYVLDPAYARYKSVAQHMYHRMLLDGYLHRSYASADAITTDSRFTAGVLEHAAGVATARVIPLWVDYDKFSPGEVEAKPHRPFRLLFVGNASRRKGADVIPVLARRLGSDFEIRCTAGLRAGQQDGMGSNVSLLGRLTQEHLIQEYRDCDALLMPSRYEGFGYSALEAMACGKPVVGFRCGAVEEVVAEGETGLLCNIDDLEALETDCRKLALDRSMAASLGRAGRVRAVAKFSEAQAVDAYMAVYQSLLAGNTMGTNEA
ncbi:MAG: glycosyltransferase family 4 protein [Rhodanobacteraceae bacterium]